MKLLGGNDAERPGGRAADDDKQDDNTASGLRSLAGHTMETGRRPLRAEVRADVDLATLQSLIEEMYSAKDRKRGAEGTFLWLMEEVGELASAIREGTTEEKEGEFADVLAWLVTLANVEGIDLQRAMRKYTDGCPGCGQMVCTCDEKP